MFLVRGGQFVWDKHDRGDNPDFSHVQNCELTRESKTISKRNFFKRLKKVVYRTNTTGEIMHISLAVALFPLHKIVNQSKKVHTQKKKKMKMIESHFWVLMFFRDDINKAYRRLAVLLHPDKSVAPGSEEAFKVLVSARTALLKRCSWDSSPVRSLWSDLRLVPSSICSPSGSVLIQLWVPRVKSCFCASSGISDLFGGIGESGSKSHCFTGMYVRPLAVGFKGFV